MCSCNIEKINVPQTYEWGPPIWKVMHSMSLKAGTCSVDSMRADEIRAWTALIPALGPMLPCEECRGHFATWIAAHPIKPFLTVPYSEKGEWIRRWLFDLHNDVNRRTGKPAFSYDQLIPTYRNTNISDTLKIVDGLMLNAMKGGGASLLKYKEWLKQMGMLRGLY